jgi:flagellar protein FlaG
MASQVSNIPVQQQSQGRTDISLNNTNEVNDERKISKESLEKVINGLNKLLEPTYTNVHYKKHDRTNSYYIQIVDSTTNEVLREIPPKKMLDIYADLLKSIGLIIDKKI